MTEPLGTRFSRLWAATALSNMADGVLVVGAPLVALEFTRSPLLVSLTSTLAMAPWLAVPLLAGALADRHDRKAILVVAAGTRAALLAVATALVATGSFNLGVLYVVVFLVGANEVFADTTTQSILPMIVPRERLDAANGRIISAQKVTADLLGAPLSQVIAQYHGDHAGHSRNQFTIILGVGYETVVATAAIIPSYGLGGLHLGWGGGMDCLRSAVQP